jgi:hypothetical protein
MKRKFDTISRFGILTVGITTFSFAGLVMSQTPRLHSSPTTSGTSAGVNAAATQGSLSAKDKAFMRKAAKGGGMEVAMGRLAEQNGKSDDVKSFGTNGHRSQQS